MKPLLLYPHDRGAALITTLVLIAAIAVVVVGVFSVNRQEVVMTSSTLSNTKARLAEQAAFEDAASLLRSVTRDDNYLVTVATEGSGKALTRYHFVSQPQAGALVHVPLFAGGAMDRASMPNLDAQPTASLASTAIGAPSIRFNNRDAEKRIQLPSLTHLGIDGQTFRENRFPTTGFVELEPQPSDPSDLRPGTRSRYTYWIEDLEGLPNLDAIESPSPYFSTPDGIPFPDPVRGGYSRHDSRTDLENGDDSGFRLAHPSNPEVFYQFPKTLRGQSMVGQIAPGISAADLSFSPWPLSGGERHPFTDLSNLAGSPYSSFDSADSIEKNRFVSGLFPYLKRPRIPYGHNYADEGELRYPLNRYVADQDMVVATIIENNLPNFEARKGGFPSAASSSDYTATIAANLIDYADDDSLPSNPSTTVNSTGQEFRGVDGYCPVNEFFVEFQYRGYTVDPGTGDYTVAFEARIYAEFWNTFSRSVEMQDVSLNFEFLDVPEFLCFSSTFRLERSDRTRDEPQDNPVTSISLEPNEIVVVPFGEIRWSVNVGNPAPLPIAFPIIENFRAAPGAGSVNPRANYQLRLGPHLVDTGGRSPDGSDDAHGFFFNQQNRFQEAVSIMRVGGSVPRIKAHGTGSTLNQAGHGIQGTSLGDPWMNYYMTATFDNFRFRTSEYRNHSSPGQRNLSRSAVPGSRADCFSDQARVRDWPDRGYDNPVGARPRSDSQAPDDAAFQLASDPRHAPWKLSGDGRYFSVTEMGHIHDPVMWVYGEPDATRFLGDQNYRDPSDRTKLNPYLLSLPTSAEPNARYGGGNTLRIGRPEHELFDQPGMRASQLLDLFHVGINGTNLAAANVSENNLLYKNHAPGQRREPLTALNEIDAQTTPFESLYSPEYHAQSQFQSQWGRININTVPTLFELEALLRGPLVSSDVVVEEATADNPVVPQYTDEGTLGELTKSLNPDSISAIAAGLFEARPFYSPSHLARVLSELIKRHDALPENHNDAEAEETFARIFNTTSFTSRHFRIHTYAETFEATTEAVLARDRKVYDVFVEPIRDNNGDIESTSLRVFRVSNL